MNNKKILFTITILLIYFLLSCLPVLGIGAEYFSKLYLGLASHRISIIALGLKPYITANILVMLIIALLPSMKTCRRKDAFASVQVNRAILGITLILSLIQSFFISLWMYRVIPAIGLPYLFFLGLTTLTITAGTFLLLFLGRLISKHGVGHGISLLIIFPMILWLLHALITSLLAKDGAENFVISFGVLILLAWITKIMLKKTQKIQLATKDPSTNPIYLNIPLSAGVLPLLFTYSILQFPGTVAAFGAPDSHFGKFDDFLYKHPVFDWVVTGALFLFFTYFIVAITFNPKSLTAKIQKQGLTRAGTPEFDWRALDKILNKFPFYFWAGFLLALDLIFVFVSYALKSQALNLSPMEFILMVGVILGVVKALKPTEFTKIVYQTNDWEQVILLEGILRSRHIALEVENDECIGGIYPILTGELGKKFLKVKESDFLKAHKIIAEIEDQEILNS